MAPGRAWATTGPRSKKSAISKAHMDFAWAEVAVAAVTRDERLAVVPSGAPREPLAR